MGRGQRILEVDGRSWRAVEAWRAESGSGLLYFLPLAEDREAPGDDDREDRRAALEPGESVEGLDRETLEERLLEGTPLTVTERRIRAPDGRPWLVQSVGPVWAEDVASGLTGLLFTALEGPHARAASGGGHAGEMSEAELYARWREATADPGDDGGRAPETDAGAEPEG